MAETEPWNDEADEQDTELLAALGAACVILAVIWTPIMWYVVGLPLALGIGGLLLTAGVLFVVGGMVTEEGA